MKRKRDMSLCSRERWAYRGMDISQEPVCFVDTPEWFSFFGGYYIVETESCREDTSLVMTSASEIGPTQEDNFSHDNIIRTENKERVGFSMGRSSFAKI